MPMPPLESETTVSGRQPDQFRQREFQELRATIRERGHLRVIVSTLTFVSWAALAATILGNRFRPLTLVPLTALAAGFEAIYVLHVGVERLGRYLFVFYEGPAEMPKWETAIAAFGPSDAARSTGGSALFVPLFVFAALLNLVLTWGAVASHTLDLVGVAIAAALAAFHGVFIGRVFIAKARAGRQRQLDTAAFRAIAADLASRQATESN
jgi:hypothetical protein